MTSLSNMKIGKKIALVLGGTALTMAALSALSIWGINTTERLAADSADRLTKSKLAQTIAGETAAIGQSSATMMLHKRIIDDVTMTLIESRRSREEALEGFKARANTPRSIKHAQEMAELVQANIDANNHLMTALREGRIAQAGEFFESASSISSNLRTKATEASQYQEKLVAENEAKREQTSKAVWMILMVGSLIAIAGAIFSGVVLTRSIARPLATAVAHLEQIASGDLSKDAHAEFQGRGDEIGTLARAKQSMIVSLRKMVQQISTGVDVLASSSTEMTSTSTQMTAGSRQASDKAHSVSTAAEEMSSNITSVAAGMEQTTTNIAHVASATEEMTSTIGAIAENSEKARLITEEATRQAARITEQINQLGVAAREIGKVTETITEISSQTNLLALNATIEAARAGAAGKGFAVVATEIKALAQQTAAATEDIKGRIASVQAATTGGIAEIEKVSQVVAEVNSIVASIAAAIEEQSVTTKDIARSIAEASLGLSDANTRVAETSHVSREIAKDIVSVHRAAGEMASGSDHVRSSAVELSTLAEDLKVTVGRFHT